MAKNDFNWNLSWEEMDYQDKNAFASELGIILTSDNSGHVKGHYEYIRKKYIK